jgi:hypothetical protein
LRQLDTIREYAGTVAATAPIIADDETPEAAAAETAEAETAEAEVVEAETAEAETTQETM